MGLAKPSLLGCSFAVSLVGAVFTLNAFMPVRRIPALFVPSFFGSWLTAELALHHIVWQAIATVLFVQFGALSAWPGLIGLGIAFGSWLGLLSLFHSGHQTRGTFEAVLSDLPELDDADQIPIGKLLLPVSAPPPRRQSDPQRQVPRDRRQEAAVGRRDAGRAGDQSPRRHADSRRRVDHRRQAGTRLAAHWAPRGKRLGPASTSTIG